LNNYKPCGRLALGQNCIKIITNKSNSVAMFLRIQTDLYIGSARQFGGPLMPMTTLMSSFPLPEI